MRLRKIETRTTVGKLGNKILYEGYCERCSKNIWLEELVLCENLIRSDILMKLKKI